MATVELKDLTLYYGDVLAVDNISLKVEDALLYVLLGPTGCGKTSTMRMIAGLEIPTAGEIYLDGLIINHIYPGDRDVAMVFQDYALYPHVTVKGHFEFPLKAKKTPRKDLVQRVQQIADFLQLSSFLKRHPGELSVGQQQRVAIGRALIRRPKVFLMDEPLGQLDGRMRAEMRASIKRLQKELGITTIYVTHDQVEAQSLGDKIVVMKQGIIQQVASPEEIYNHPVNLFVAGFIGTPSMNLLDCSLHRDNGETRLRNDHFSFALPPSGAEKMGAVPEGARLMLGIRPEHIRLNVGYDPNANVSEIAVVEPHSNDYVVGLKLGNIPIKVKQDKRSLDFRPEVGQTVRVRLLPEKIHLFDKETELSLL